jgi:hypothetical protein
MKLASVATAAALDSSDFFEARLFSFFLDVPLHLTDVGMDIVFDAGEGAVTFDSANGAVRRGPSKVALSLEPDEVEVSIALGVLPEAAARGIQLAAARGVFDGKRVRVLRLASLRYAGDTAGGAIVDVDGPGQVSDVTSTELRLSVKSRTERLRHALPPRVWQPACPWLLYSPGCGASLATNSETRTCAAGGTTSSVVTTVAFTLAYADSLVWFTSGRNVGVQRNVKSGGATVVPSVPFPFAPAAGDTVVVARGCDHRRETCDLTFHNLANFGGQPDIPDKVPNAIITE